MDKLDINSIKIMSFLYGSDFRTVRDIMNKFELHAESSRRYIKMWIEFCLCEGYVGIAAGEKWCVLKSDAQSYIQHCRSQGIETILPNYTIFLLPAGRAAVENDRRRKWQFLAPLVVSVVSAFISIVALLR